ncbi:MAG: chemotaxis-specific protein-glutamate methyltransferase CheB [Bacteriovoracaceae bacterium]|nr:chemotaxis-specific protein-glutamate methyltransferase CheB [Bacteriovoracaceae bacterium]
MSSNLTLGKIISETAGKWKIDLIPDYVFVWKQGPKPQSIFCKNLDEIPTTWWSGEPCKVFYFHQNKNLVSSQSKLPPGSKLIAYQLTTPRAQVELDFSSNVVRFQGKRTKRVLMVEDSPTMRKVLKHIFLQFPDWELISESASAKDLSEQLLIHLPDLVTLDLHLGDSNGIEIMQRFLSPKKIPTILITSQSIKDGNMVMEALSAGAMDYLQKPQTNNWNELKDALLEKMNLIVNAKWLNKSSFKNEINSQFKLQFSDFDHTIIAIGSSTGGPQALQEVLQNLPDEIPPILITQHIPAGFSKALADRLNTLCPFTIKEAQDGETISRNVVYIAPGDKHMLITQDGTRIALDDSPPINRFRPSVDAMFQSISLRCKKKIVGVILTGMGKDGAQGLLQLRNLGALTIAQDEATCVVYGMPKEAIRLEAAQSITPIQHVANEIVKLANLKVSTMKLAK